MARIAPLQRAFTNFPAGSAGAALFFLRASIGTLATIEAVLCIVDTQSATRYLLAIPALLAGIALLPGWLVPVASVLLGAEGLALLILAPSDALHLLASRIALVEFIVMAAVVAVLGPGATSMDARRFGRREVEIA